MSFIIGVSGGIASGKTTAGNYFLTKNISTIDTDYIAGKLLKNNLIIDKIVSSFGHSALNKEKLIDKDFIRKIVFSDLSKLRILEKIIHPEVTKEVFNILDEYKSLEKIAIISPLMFESGMNIITDHTMAIDVGVDVQIRRIMERGVEKNQAKKIILNQIDRRTRNECADSIVCNNSSKEEFYLELDKLNLFCTKNKHNATVLEFCTD